jgi:uncharacterized protein (DUF433 family)
VNAIAEPQEFWRARLDTPNYDVSEAARYAHIHANSVARWQRSATIRDRAARIKLSYLQLIELAVVASAKKAGMRLVDIRVARAYFAAAFDTDHPFATIRLSTDGVDIATKAGAELLIGNKRGQLAWKSVIGRRFKEFEYEDNIVARWHVGGEGSPGVIDPRVRFGAPQVGGVPTWLLRERWVSGEPLDEITDDLSLDEATVISALRFEGVDPGKRRTTEWLN